MGETLKDHRLGSFDAQMISEHTLTSGFTMMMKTSAMIESAINSLQGFSHSEFYFDVQGDFDVAELRELLRAFHNEVTNAKLSSFLDLEELYEKYDSKN